jgi:hypothetical protein
VSDPLGAQSEYAVELPTDTPGVGPSESLDAQAARRSNAPVRDRSLELVRINFIGSLPSGRFMTVLRRREKSRRFSRVNWRSSKRRQVQSR